MFVNAACRAVRSSAARSFSTAARASAARASAASIKSLALGGLSLAAGVAAFAAVQPEVRPAMCAAAASAERTYIMIKPDGVQRGLIADIIARFEKRGYKLVALKIRQPTKELLEKHYSDLADKAFFPGLVKYMLSGPVVCMVWEGKDAVKTGRKMLGATNPLASEPGTIRGDYCLEVGRNICHGSDSVESANKEIALWFSKDELVNWTTHSQAWIYE